jgi:hypothetical protein
LKRGHYVVIGGAALFVIGIALTTIWALPIAKQIQQDTALLQGREIAAGQSESLSLDVEDTSRPLSVIVASSNPSAQLRAILETPDGQTAINSTFSENTVLSAEPAVAGTYTLTIANVGQSETNVDVVFGRLPGLEENNQVAVETYGGVFAGLGVIFAGMMVMVAGVVIIVVDRRRRS